MPAVSIRVSCSPVGSVMVVSTASLVVPLMSQTMARSSPQMALRRLLLPAWQQQDAHSTGELDVQDGSGTMPMLRQEPLYLRELSGWCIIGQNATVTTCSTKLVCGVRICHTVAS
eukprot:GHRR01034539.1.p2 GENE.GHRR01034539.1~~GHRR01034539.1.p2  ORF type:complete len:115 (-),score=22.94 GHRR01034539.1:271-615(-)